MLVKELETRIKDNKERFAMQRAEYQEEREKMVLRCRDMERENGELKRAIGDKDRVIEGLRKEVQDRSKRDESKGARYKR